MPTNYSRATDVSSIEFLFVAALAIVVTFALVEMYRTYRRTHPWHRADDK